MLNDLFENYEIDTDEYIEIPFIKGLHTELINENIREQIDNPFETQVNFIDEYFKTFDNEKESGDENPEVVQAMERDAFDFCYTIINMIDDKYDLNIDQAALDDFSLEKLKSLTYALYDFFVVHYPKNIKKFYVKYILSNLEEIAGVFKDYDDHNDVVTQAFKEKLNDNNAVTVISNLKKVIEYINSLEIKGMDMLSFFNQDRYDIYVLTEAIQDLTIDETFVEKFCYPLKSEFEDEHYTEIYLAIESGLIKKFKKKAIEELGE